ncbi:hypothetical protein TNCV_1165441 [Trichonephila clavipes]|nr:hypothetical protein TNCV_1165441 [Trichonephila clavipes]
MRNFLSTFLRERTFLKAEKKNQTKRKGKKEEIKEKVTSKKVNQKDDGGDESLAKRPAMHTHGPPAKPGFEPQARSYKGIRSTWCQSGLGPSNTLPWDTWCQSGLGPPNTLPPAMRGCALRNCSYYYRLFGGQQPTGADVTYVRSFEDKEKNNTIL